MTDDETTNGEEGGESIDYDAKQAEIDKAKAKAHDDDAKRLAAEHE